MLWPDFKDVAYVRLELSATDRYVQKYSELD